VPFVGLLILALQIFFAVHAIRTNKQSFWLWIIILAPGIGCAVYFITQFLPEAAGSRTVRQARNTLIRAVDPERELRRRKEALAFTNTVANRVALADECLEAGMYLDAIELLQEALSGLHATDPAIMERLARAQFLARQPDRCLATLDALIAANPSYRSPDSHLLYARSLEGVGRTEDATKEYEVLRTSFPGEEARVRYALLLKSTGHTEQAAELFRETLSRAQRAPGHYRAREREWLKIAERG
jgi:hypothetical protein